MMRRRTDGGNSGDDERRARLQPSQLAVLLTDHPPADGIRLVTAEGLPAVKFRFRPVHYYPQRSALLGLASPPSSGRLPENPDFTVQRGRRGGKPPERLFLLGRSRPGFATGSKVQAGGMYKAVDRALADVHPGPDPGALEWWLAVEFAWRGFTAQRRAAARAEAAGQELAFDAARIASEQGLLVWHEYLERMCAQLRRGMLHGRRNPFLGVLTAEVVLHRLKTGSRALAEMILGFFAKLEKLELGEESGGASVSLSGELAPPEPDEVDALAVETVLAALADGGVPGRNALYKLVPSQPHVIAWLFDSGRLVEAPDGYLFTARELAGYRRQLLAAGLDPAEAGVGELKSRLKLGRKAAEGLRSLLVATSG